MKKLLFLISLIFSTIIAKAQINSEITTKKVVKDGQKFYIESRTVKLEYRLVDFNILFLVENDSLEDAQDAVLVEKFKADRLKLKAERAERNSLLKDAIKRGYEPENPTDKEIQRLNKIKARLK